VNFGTLTYESGPGYLEDFPYTDDPVYVLGESYSAKYDREELRKDVLSRIWITYRRYFAPIGGMGGPTSDRGWGCMLRCGQMMLAQVLLLRHLGRKWRWEDDRIDDIYLKILRLFEDKKACIYSIHQIASMGEAEGKAIGQWFGPNTIAQVLKRIAVYDRWSDVVIHVALDNLVVLDEIRKACKASAPSSSSEEDSGEIPKNVTFSNFVNDGDEKGNETAAQSKWRPLFLVIPLRLGLTEINPIYFSSIKKCFMLHQSVGIVGGKPNHAHYFIGFIGQELIYLDPHTEQNTVDLEQRNASDQTYHCSASSRMLFHKLDPSIALGFYCETEHDFDQLCTHFTVSDASCPAMFEVRKESPPLWPGSASKSSSGATGGRARTMSLSDFADIPESPTACESSLDDEEFEII